MCLILLAIKAHPDYKLILAANRDEFYDRPTAPASFWMEAPHLLAGKDLKAGGTWMGVTTSGRIAAVTNYRDFDANKQDAPSRGKLVTRFLLGQESPKEYLERLRQTAGQYNGFNLVVGSPEELLWFSNRETTPQSLTPGMYGISNHLLDTPWVKVTRGKERLRGLLHRGDLVDSEAVFAILEDDTIALDAALPETGVGLEWERLLSPIFISSPTYGTRSSMVLMIDHQDRVTFFERTFTAGRRTKETQRFQFEIESDRRPSNASV
jgi:uncharacterized protein with NRDE domain